MEPLQPSRRDAAQIWQTGVDAVRADRLVHNVLACNGQTLSFSGETIELCNTGRIAVVGAGKGGARMALAVEEIFGVRLVEEKVVGWLNVPENCVCKLQKIHLHAARPAGVNEPTAEGVAGSEKILEMVGQLTQADLCLVLISGGGSALLPAPQPPITLSDLLSVTRLLMRSGATINELNTVRKCLSRIKGGGLARASRAAALWSLIISDVVGDPLDVIASGPTVADQTQFAAARAILTRFGEEPGAVPKRVLDFLEQPLVDAQRQEPFPTNVYNLIIGNNHSAVAAARLEAERLGYQVISMGSDNQGQAGLEGRKLAEQCLQLRHRGVRTAPGICVLSGGEPVVQLGEDPGKGGRNQQLVLSAVARLWEDGMGQITLLSGGTDGEDGPTDAAGACADADLLAAARKRGLDPDEYLKGHNAYAFFDPLGGLLRTGPTDTNVMDLRVAIVEK